MKLLSSLQYLEDQLLILAALIACEIPDILHARRLDRREAVAPVGILDNAGDIIPDLHLTRENILHSIDRLFL